MPADGLPWLERSELLTYEEIERLVRLMVSMGVEDVRLTGGEPLVRRDLPSLVAMLCRIPDPPEVSLTTNGQLLERHAAALAAAGLERVNVSIDSLDPHRFEELTRRDALDQVLRGLDAVAAAPRITKVKVNAVAMRGFTEQEVLRFCEFARNTRFQVRFIEFMPLDGDRAWRPENVLSGAEVRAMITAAHPLVEVPREPSATARVFRFRDGPGEVGFISPVSEPFCADCNRIRLTAEGKLRTCLFSHRETDLRAPLREGAGDEEVARIIRDAVWRKELKHRIGEPGFVQPRRTMSAIGG